MVYLPSFNAKMSFCALDVQCTNFFKGANSARTFKKKLVHYASKAQKDMLALEEEEERYTISDL